MAAGQSKLDSFSYSISDGNGGTDTATVDVTVFGFNEPGAGGGSSKLLDSVSPDVELDYYIRVEGSPEWLRLEGFSMELSNSGGLGGAGGGAGAGKVSASDLQALLGSSSTVVMLTQELNAGKFLDSIEIEAYRPGGEKGPSLVDQYYFEDVLVTGLQTRGDAFTTSNDLSFDFAKFNHGHVEYDAKGGIKGTAEAGWDFVQNVSFTGGPSVAGEAAKAKLDEGLPTDVQLEYYVTFEGAPGWLQLDSFSMGLENSGGVGGAGGGAGASKTSASELELLLGSSKQILDLTKGITTGAHFEFFEIEAYRAGSKEGPQLVDQYYFENVFVTGLDTDGANNNSVSLDYGAFSHGHVEYDAKGAKGPTTQAGWDYITNEPFSHPVAPDVDLF
jgi:type VI protein secretion system component Hcp